MIKGVELSSWEHVCKCMFVCMCVCICESVHVCTCVSVWMASGTPSNEMLVPVLYGRGCCLLKKVCRAPAVEDDFYD